MPEVKTAEELATEVKAAFETQLSAVRAIAEDALGKAKAGEPLTQAAKDKADEALLKLAPLVALKETVATLEQKLLEGLGKGQPEQQKSIGQMFIDDPKVKAFLAEPNPRGKVDFTVKTTLTSLTTDAGGSVGNSLRPTRLPNIVPYLQQPLRVRDLLSQGQMDGTTLEYVQMHGFTNSAAMVAEGAAKSGSDIKTKLVSTSAKVIAHYMKASRQVLDDISQLRSQIDEILLYGLKLKEESQILNGDGTGQNLNGTITQATAYAAPTTVSDITMLDVLRLAMLQATLALVPPTGHVIHPTDWAVIETMKDSVGRYIIGNPQGSINPTLWGLPVVESMSMTVRKFLTGAFKMGAQIFDRWQARVEIATENEDDFIKNLVTILAEERLALAVYRPEGFIYGDFDTALAA